METRLLQRNLNFMCGRFTLKISPRVLEKQFLLKDSQLDLGDRFNIAPSQQVLGIRTAGDSAGSEAFRARWGLIPFWAKDEKIGYKMINARSETAPSKPAFRAAMKQRRCILPASGFYEWKREGKHKQPFYIYPRDPDPDAPYLAMAGLWESWKNPEGEPVISATILTTAANDMMAGLHDRMPVFLSPDAREPWLDTDRELSEDEYLSLTRPAPDSLLTCYPVSSRVNSPRNEDPSLVEPVDNPPPFRSREESKEGPEQQDLL